MKLIFEFDLGEVEIETNSNHGRLDSVWVNGKNYAERSVDDFIVALAGGPIGWSRLIALKEQIEQDPEKDRPEDQYGVPI